MNRFLPIAPIIGLILMLFSVTYLLPIATALVYHDGTLSFFMEGMSTCFLSGSLLWIATRHFQRELRPADGYLLVVLAWGVTAAMATQPLILAIGGLSFTDAYFETMSGFTTTGATVLTGIDKLPQAINLWRHLLHWLGGMGIIMLAIAILPLLGVGGRQLYRAETPGPMKDTKLTPRLAETAKNLWYLYVGLTGACIVALWLAGMNWFDAICHAFATLSLGGFSTHDASIGFFDSVAIEAVLIFFMLLAAMNFATHFLAWRRWSLSPYGHDPELQPFLALIFLSCLGIAMFLWRHGVYPDFGTALRHASFNLISIATDCGFVSVDYGQWPIFAPLWILFLSCVAACSGSTGGGMKLIRSLILYRQTAREMVTLVHPHAIHPLTIGSLAIGSLAVPTQVILSVLGFVELYFFSILVMTFVLVASGLDFLSSFSAIIACINNAGPGLNKVGPATNYASLTDFQTWVCTTTMLLGRLELFTVVVIFTRVFWRG